MFTKTGKMVGVDLVSVVLTRFRPTGGQNFRFPIDFAGHHHKSAATAVQPTS